MKFTITVHQIYELKQLSEAFFFLTVFSKADDQCVFLILL